ncbi:MAG: copper-translocating P-type ATPase [Paracoccaceae bacterium]|nr:MAG: copper-translocating P-type ATPase [Paracoccaceae bacterium]
MARDEIPPPGSCCPAGAAVALSGAEGAGLFARDVGGGLREIELLVPAAHCAACIGTIERGLAAMPGVALARLNLSLKRLTVRFDPARVAAGAVLERLAGLGYDARPVDAAQMRALARDPEGRDLLARLGVAGFAAMNVMLLSVGVWAGAEAATRDLMHWVSAAIALPAVAFAGVPFYRSALRALRAGRLNMDVPISLALILAAGVSLSETAQGGPEAYFDAAVMLAFFLLLGRVLDHRTRRLARSAAAQLASLSARTAQLLTPEGPRLVRVEDLRPGDEVLVAAGETFPADGEVLSGESAIDRAMVTGESVPQPAGPGDAVHAGMVNLAAPLRVRVSASGEATLIAEIGRMVAAAEAGRNRYTRLADRAARIYAPLVHLAAALTFAGWLWAGLPAREALMIAASVLIITCPCALGLAVPVVQVVAGGRLFRAGVFVKDGAALERLAEADMVVFDKTGTLTEGRPEVIAMPGDPAARAAALALAEASGHPHARAIAAALRALGVRPAPVTGIAETPGAGVAGRLDGAEIRLGRADWCGLPRGDDTEVWLAGPGGAACFRLADRPKADAAATVAALKARGMAVTLLSGDAPGAVADTARAVGIADWRARLTPAEKCAALADLAARGHRVLMVGDGLNDAPALAAAHVSISPAGATDIARAAADLVIPAGRLEPVLAALAEARTARARALQNFAIAALYNALAVPLAVAGLVSPLVAALAMSGSSILVTLNALRPGGRG